jgi:hypothetical protein
MNCPDIKMTNNYSNPVDERGSKIGVLKNLIRNGALDIFFFHQT